MRSASCALLVVLALGCGGGDGTGGTTNPPPGGGGTTPVATTSVTLQGSAFVPPAIVVAPSATVTWTNSDGFDHNVTFASTAIVSIGNFSSGARTAAMPAAVGTYTYRCTIHPGMNGSVKVE